MRECRADQERGQQEAVGPRPSRPHGLGTAVEEGIVDTSLHASYLHVHWAGHPELAARFVTAAARYAGVPAVTRDRLDRVRPDGR
ncbi:hypothetical protein [Plantactinospora soyae]|uniref:Cobyrinic acid a,c-diamide synthase n=1 Tax=Plantactinospora soyae TaxID=1544732 RepID=A0A927MIJ0_9ACTN|nr:hypothetical protein [Plantactinospora soyae]MBE1491800.1 cobyrinic acid a,c-diamide synthase [Plantactinospora soyae]